MSEQSQEPKRDPDTPTEPMGEGTEGDQAREGDDERARRARGAQQVGVPEGTEDIESRKERIASQSDTTEPDEGASPTGDDT